MSFAGQLFFVVNSLLPSRGVDVKKTTASPETELSRPCNCVCLRHGRSPITGWRPVQDLRATCWTGGQRFFHRKVK